MLRVRFGLGFGVALVGLLGVACSASPTNPSGGSGGVGATGGSGGNAGGTGGASSGGNGGTGNVTFGGFGGTGGGASTCNSGPNDDADMDGFTPAQGDCNDCDANTNPGAVDVIAGPDAMGNVPDPVDEDCNGIVDDGVAACDDNLPIDDFDPMNGAKALDLCKVAQNGSWGVLEATYVRSNGVTPLTPTQGVGLLDVWGSVVAPQKGARMLGLSSGYARDANDTGACGFQSCNHSFGDLSANVNPGTAPGGAFCDAGGTCYPVDAAGCTPTNKSVNDDVGLRLKIRAPSNANGLKYQFRFASFEFPEYVCSAYNDQYVALMTPPPVGAIDSNISFDSVGNAVSVNVGFFSVCDPGLLGSYAIYGSPKVPPAGTCASGPGELAGTGFDVWGDGGGTGWLQTTAPVEGSQEFELLFTIWDTSDSALDSLVLIDKFEWIADGGTVTVVTEPPPPN